MEEQKVTILVIFFELAYQQDETTLHYLLHASDQPALLYLSLHFSFEVPGSFINTPAGSSHFEVFCTFSRERHACHEPWKSHCHAGARSTGVWGW